MSRKQGERRWEGTDGYPCFASPVTVQCAWLITNSKNMHGQALAFQIACTCECDLKDVFYAAACGWSMLFFLSCWENITLGYSNSARGSSLHRPLRSVMYMDGVWGLCCSPVTVSAEKRAVSALQTVIPPMYSRCFCLLPFLPSLILFPAFHFLHKGKMRKNKTNIWKLKHDRAGRGRGEGEEGETEEGEAISENKRAFKSKGWKLVRLLFLKNDPCVVLLLRARYILFYLPEKTQWGVLAPKKTQQ